MSLFRKNTKESQEGGDKAVALEASATKPIVASRPPVMSGVIFVPPPNCFEDAPEFSLIVTGNPYAENVKCGSAHNSRGTIEGAVVLVNSDVGAGVKAPRTIRCARCKVINCDSNTA